MHSTSVASDGMAASSKSNLVLSDGSLCVDGAPAVSELRPLLEGSRIWSKSVATRRPVPRFSDLAGFARAIWPAEMLSAPELVLAPSVTGPVMLSSSRSAASCRLPSNYFIFSNAPLS